jgi:hypothetical protein
MAPNQRSEQCKVTNLSLYKLKLQFGLNDIRFGLVSAVVEVVVVGDDPAIAGFHGRT